MREAQRMRIIEQGRECVELSRSQTGEIVLRVGSSRNEDGREIGLNLGEARVIAYSLLAAAARSQDAEWPEAYWAEGTFPHPS